MEDSRSISLLIYLNRNLKKKIKITVNNSTSLSTLIAICKDKFKIATNSKCFFYDSRGDIISDDDLEYINPQEPLFFSLGEEYSQNILLALYKHIKTIGKGGFGTVKLYKHRITSKYVAIKFIKTSKLVRPEIVSRAYKEIQLLRDLVHPNIVSLIDVFPISNQICFIMEFCEGGELKKYIQEKENISEDEVVDLSLQICEAVRYCHNSNVIHRDLKPENIMFKDVNRKNIVIVDFGIAGIFNPGTLGEKSTAGSFLYMAPEILSGQNHSACPEIDVWSLGCIIYYLLTGQRPFSGYDKKETLKNILAGDYYEIAQEKKHWKELIDGTLAVDPTKRWSVLRIIEYLHKIKNGEALEETKIKFYHTQVKFSESLRNVKTPELDVKLPNIKAKRYKTVPRKK